MSFAENQIRDQLKDRIIAGTVGSTMFNTYEDKDDNEYMHNVGGNMCGPLPCGCKLYMVSKQNCPMKTSHMDIVQYKIKKYNQAYDAYKCVKTNRILSVINLMLLILLIILVYVLCFEVGKNNK